MVKVDVAGLFGDNLVRVRKRTGLSQDDLAMRASVHRTEISQLERGLRIARIDTLVKLAGSLEVAPGELLTGCRGRRDQPAWADSSSPMRALASSYEPGRV